MYTLLNGRNDVQQNRAHIWAFTYTHNGGHTKSTIKKNQNSSTWRMHTTELIDPQPPFSPHTPNAHTLTHTSIYILFWLNNNCFTFSEFCSCRFHVERKRVIEFEYNVDHTNKMNEFCFYSSTRTYELNKILLCFAYKQIKCSFSVLSFLQSDCSVKMNSVFLLETQYQSRSNQQKKIIISPLCVQLTIYFNMWSPSLRCAHDIRYSQCRISIATDAAGIAAIVVVVVVVRYSRECTLFTVYVHCIMRTCEWCSSVPKPHETELSMKLFRKLFLILP